MKIPSIDENIAHLMGGGPNKSSVDRNRMCDGVPLFNKDSIRASKNDLDIELRYIFDHYKIGKGYFAEKSVEYYQRVEGQSKDKAKSSCQNLVRTLEKSDITFNRECEALRVLGFEVVDRSITIRDDIGELHTFSLSKAMEHCRSDE